mmetsp:Transcript_45779/g.128808  ORF Transcript_45779/g.128808 Transcript_45779/m.128808 type:complete len:336 (-) Transcript_45779:28-1035(-)
MLEHVFHVLGSNEGIVDGNNVDHRVVLGGTHDKTSNTSKSIDTDVDRLQGLCATLAVDDIGEFRLERSTSHKESINIGLGRKTGSGLSAGRSTVKDTGLVGNIGSSNFSEVLADISMGFLSLLGGGSKTSTDGPDGFIGNDNIFPVFLGENISIGLDLREDEIVGGSSFTVFKGFSTACHDLESLVQGVLRLRRNLSITFSLSTTFGVTNNCPLGSHISQHIGTSLTSVSTVSLGPDILGTDGDISAKPVLDRLKVKLGWADNYFGIRAKSHLVQHRDELIGLGNGSIALPVSSNEELAGFNLGRRRVGASGNLGNGRRDRSSGLHVGDFFLLLD